MGMKKTATMCVKGKRGSLINVECVYTKSDRGRGQSLDRDKGQIEDTRFRF